MRLQRQALLLRRLPPPPRFDVMLSEAVLLRVVGGPATMAEQLRRLVEVSLPGVVAVRDSKDRTGLVLTFTPDS